MKHEMTLYPEYFNSLVSGHKRIEVRLYDEKRRRININDSIIFYQLPGKSKSVEAVVKELLIYKTFEELYRAHPFKEFGCEGWSMDEMITGTYEIYSPEQEKKWGALGIRIEIKN
ncbi:hypothetical protein DNH61_24665 [Paenibacillus sambharensis]|uniref:ASCH domain-containing protein n=1 Tax=Paenibacillus sambharensis TaxID=1803190 RepID=A0A2W1KZN1_9BACL|nr:ASCH domain-containing protein [Paenibacillus sambharensis]PZD93128.1 hypothetical protein DNH61_24665 [Paenibacillus sambharensis]